ncbi:MAG: FIST C-terminal domain-containing protein, partial [Chloroflexota bacterium]|nr:FIST C-terminal domain-containing protein [Chloroflexota bacterium]
MPAPLLGPVSLARVAIGFHTDWRRAVEKATGALAGSAPDLVLAFCDSSFASELPAVAEQIWRTLGAPLVFGASGSGVIADSDEYERQPGVVLLAVSLPGAILSPVRLNTLLFEGPTDPESWRRRIGVLPTDVHGWIVLASPFRFDLDTALGTIRAAYPAVPIVGGIASPDPLSRQSALILNGEALYDGAIALGIGGPYHLITALSQGADPIGQPWTITAVDGDWIVEIGGRPAVTVLERTMLDMPDELRIRTHRNLLIGLALDEYRAEHRRGDFLIRGIAGIEQASGAIAVGAPVRVGQTVQFQIRNPAVADLDLTSCLNDLRMRLAGVRPAFGVGFSGYERGLDLFGRPNHDAGAIQKRLPGVPFAGLSTA